MSDSRKAYEDSLIQTDRAGRPLDIDSMSDEKVPASGGIAATDLGYLPYDATRRGLAGVQNGPGYGMTSYQAGHPGTPISVSGREYLRAVEAVVKPADNVNRPAHYTSGKIEVLDFIEDKGFGYLAGQVIKYVARYRLKNGLEDLQKAEFYLKRLIKRGGVDFGSSN